jgi:hypothetical protein
MLIFIFNFLVWVLIIGYCQVKTSQLLLNFQPNPSFEASNLQLIIQQKMQIN